MCSHRRVVLSAGLQWRPRVKGLPKAGLGIELKELAAKRSGDIVRSTTG